ncbi:dynein light chain roadblock-type 1 [Drosophila tropicalis]|uniref:dynein light chain roadblock-type 1 n=1 Tax=Drosophila tropicalis TaxID=46794 RepID=UPI0035AC24C0
MSAEVEELLKRFQAYKNIAGIIVVDNDGIPIKTTLDNTQTVHYAALMQNFVLKARQVVLDLDATNELTLLRMRTLTNEVILATSDNFYLIVIQKPSD